MPRAVVRTAALQANLKSIRDRVAPARVMAVVKSNGYGHGLVTAARAFAAADSLAVARQAEAMALREAGIRNRIVLLEGVDTAADYERAAAAGFEPVIHRVGQIRELRGSKDSDKLVVWLKIDTGMNRLGFHAEQAGAALSELQSLSGVAEVRLMTHFACADVPEHPLNRRQLERFADIVSGFDGAVSLANSAAALSLPESYGPGATLKPGVQSWVRPGLALYGISPFPGRSGRDFGLQPAMSFRTRLIAIRRVLAGETIGYGGEFLATEPLTVGVAAAGYGDGYPRVAWPGAEVALGGQRSRVLGRVSMDMLVIDLTQFEPTSVDVGAEVVLWGEEPTVEEVASHAGTVAYELLAGMPGRVRRVEN